MAARRGPYAVVRTWTLTLIVSGGQCRFDKGSDIIWLTFLKHYCYCSVGTVQRQRQKHQERLGGHYNQYSRQLMMVAWVGSSPGEGRKWSGSGCVLMAESTGLPDKLFNWGVKDDSLILVLSTEGQSCQNWDEECCGYSRFQMREWGKLEVSLWTCWGWDIYWHPRCWVNNSKRAFRFPKVYFCVSDRVGQLCQQAGAQPSYSK